MILVDTSVWVDHLHRGDSAMHRLLQERQVLSHPMVIGEIAMGYLDPREEILAVLHLIPRAKIATYAEVLQLVSAHKLYGRGIGYVDAHLLAAARIGVKVTLWTRDKRLAAIATELGIAYEPG